MKISRSQHPTFMVIGAPKSGTTSFFSTLCSHPDVFKSSYKETLYFSSESEYEKGLAYYLNTFFKGAENCRCKGEATPSYLQGGSKVAGRIKEQLDFNALKFIVILRDPVERSWSQYLHRKRSMHETLEFDAALEAESIRSAKGDLFSGYFEFSRYGHQLSQWISEGTREQFLIIRYDELCDDYVGTLGRAATFLALESSFKFQNSGRKNQAGEPRFKVLMSYLRSEQSLSKSIVKRIVPSALRRGIKIRLKQLNIKSFSEDNKPVMPVETGMRLRERFTDDIVLLEKVSGMDFSSWKSR